MEGGWATVPVGGLEEECAWPSFLLVASDAVDGARPSFRLVALEEEPARPLFRLAALDAVGDEDDIPQPVGGISIVTYEYILLERGGN